MNKIALAGALALTVTLGSCGTNGWNTAATTATTIAADIQKFIKAVDAVAIRVCGFLPTDATVRGIIDATSPATATVDTIAQAICSAVKVFPLSSRRLGGRLGDPTVPTVAGVPVHGRFVR